MMDVFYPNLVGEIAKRGIKKYQIASCLGVAVKTFQNKMNGNVAFTWPEAKQIQREFFPDISKDVLFMSALDIEGKVS